MKDGEKTDKGCDDAAIRKSRAERGSFMRVLRDLKKLRPRQGAGRFKGLVNLGEIGAKTNLSSELEVGKILEYCSNVYQENLPAWLEAIVTRDSGLQEYIEKAFLYIRDMQSRLMKEIDSVPDHSHSQMVSRLEHNIKQNRYPDILPYEASRIPLSNPNIPSGSYVNASRVGGFMGIPSIIATQGPLPDTTEAFWCLIWEQDVSLVLMIVQNDVFGTPIGCHRYWPSGDSTLNLSNLKMTVSLLSEKQVEEHEICVRKFKLAMNTSDDSASTRIVIQVQYTGWVDFDVSSAEKVLYIYDLVSAMASKHPGGGESANEGGSNRGHKLAIHCSAGCGRTGTFIAIYGVLEVMRGAKIHHVKDLDFALISPMDKSDNKIRNVLRRTICTHKQRSTFDSTPLDLVVIDPLKGYFDIVFVVVLSLRSQRTHMVFAQQQYALIYEAVALRIFQWQSQTPIDFPSWIKRYTQASLMQVSETSWSQLAVSTLLSGDKSNVE